MIPFLHSFLCSVVSFLFDITTDTRAFPPLLHHFRLSSVFPLFLLFTTSPQPPIVTTTVNLYHNRQLQHPPPTPTPTRQGVSVTATKSSPIHPKSTSLPLTHRKSKPLHRPRDPSPPIGSLPNRRYSRISPPEYQRCTLLALIVCPNAPRIQDTN